MNINRLSPVGLKLFNLFKECRKVYSVRKLSSEINFVSYVKLNISLGMGLAFIWPMKKKSETKVEDKVEKAPSIVETADELFENGHYEECYRILLHSEENDNVEVQWRICRALYNMSKEPKYDEALRKDYVSEAFELISEQLERNWQHFAVQKWYALLLDAKSNYNGIKERIKQLENVKKHMDLAVTINPNDATTLYMLGEWCYQVADMPWHQRKIAEVLFASPPRSTYEDALEYFLRAETVQPRFYSLNLLRLGSCYMKLQKEDQAKYYLALAASYPAKSNDDHLANKEAAELLKKLKN
ncbi:regulator of microtubule dynamics protein 1-like [Pectinophora gossypiella]|uniref:regulator of microtubule dynamics protein 1-like n=1 Tax=Pectinophora gossypiella TaxID=13191 RepID=UPI00214E49FA|nr:regulator of microtubule dynamics protein 1-like [Pectinophora gossypiella]